MSTFKSLNVITPILEALEAEGYSNPTSIQHQAIPPILQGKDLLGCAQTGTGKTAAFAIPVLQILHSKHSESKGHKKVKALVLTPTRELAIQIGESFAAYGKYTSIKHTVVYGGVSQYSQVAAIQKGIDILVATPGRLLDLMNQGLVNLSTIEILVLDEADRMLDMGFINDVRKVLKKLPTSRQTLFFSATLSLEIRELAGTLLVNPVKVEVTPVSSTAETVNQSVYFVEKEKKRALLLHLLNEGSIPAALIFSRTKHGADRIAKDLNKSGILAGAIHGDKSQNARQLALQNFKSNKLRVLVATDIAARGIDIEKLSHVINYDLPNEPETYVHRIGRTGRAGANGVALSFCASDEKPYLKQISKLIDKSIPVIKDHPYLSTNDNGVAGEVSVSVATEIKKSRNAKKWFKNRKAKVQKRA